MENPQVIKSSCVTKCVLPAVARLHPTTLMAEEKLSREATNKKRR